MFNYPIEKYQFYTNDKDKVIAVSSYGGKIVRGVAKCDANDTWDIEKGKRLAAARCAQKIADKRLARAKREYEKAYAEFDKASVRLNKMNDYKSDAKTAAIAAKSTVNQLLKSM